MKKTLTIIVATIVVITSGYAQALATSVTPSSGSDCTLMTYDLTDFNNASNIFNADTGDWIVGWDGSGVPEPLCPDYSPTDNMQALLPAGSYILDNDNGSGCYQQTWADCQTNGGLIDYTTFTITGGTSATSLSSIIANASSTMASSIGVTGGDAVGFMYPLLALAIGSGVGILQTLLPYIIALVVISAIVYFLYRGFRYYRQ